MNKEERDKLIVEALGGCWHEWELADLIKNNLRFCIKCKTWLPIVSGTDWGIAVPDLSTPAGFFWVWDRAKEKEDWGLFKDFTRNYSFVDWHNHCFLELLINPDRFADTLAEFLKRRK